MSIRKIDLPFTFTFEWRNDEYLKHSQMIKEYYTKEYAKDEFMNNIARSWVATASINQWSAVVRNMLNEETINLTPNKIVTNSYKWWLEKVNGVFDESKHALEIVNPLLQTQYESEMAKIPFDEQDDFETWIVQKFYSEPYTRANLQNPKWMESTNIKAGIVLNQMIVEAPRFNSPVTVYRGMVVNDVNLLRMQRSVDGKLLRLDNQQLELLEKKLSSVSSLLPKAPRLSEAKFDSSNSLNVGQVFELPVLSSTSLDPAGAFAFYVGKRNLRENQDVCCFLEFKLPANYPCLPIVHLSQRNEWEVVLPAKTDSGVPEYIVTNVRKETVNVDYVEVERQNHGGDRSVHEKKLQDQKLPLNGTVTVRVITLEPIHVAYVYHAIYGATNAPETGKTESITSQTPPEISEDELINEDTIDKLEEEWECNISCDK